MENFQFRFHSQLDFLKSLLEDRIIGENRAMISSFCFPPLKTKTILDMIENLVVVLC